MAVSRSLSQIAIAFLFLQIFLASASCFYPNHTTNPFPDYQPCGNGPSPDDISMCCAVQRSGGEDVCQKNGLCSNVIIGEDNFWRESCTDRSWNSESCLKLCIEGVGALYCSVPFRSSQSLLLDQANPTATSVDKNGVPMNATDRMVNKCPNGSFCCRDLNSTCCDDGDGLWIDTSNYQLRNYDPSKTTISSTSSTSTSSSSSSKGPAIAEATGSAGQPVATSQATAKSSSTNMTGAIAGGVVGGVVVLAILTGLGWFFYRKRHLRGSSGEGDYRRRTLHEASGDSVPVQSPYISEKDGRALPVEIDGNELNAKNGELEGSPLMEEVGNTQDGYKGRDAQEDFPIPTKQEYKSQIADHLARANSDS